MLADQRQDVVVTFAELNKLSKTLAENSGTIDAAIRRIPLP